MSKSNKKSKSTQIVRQAQKPCTNAKLPKTPYMNLPESKSGSGTEPESEFMMRLREEDSRRYTKEDLLDNVQQFRELIGSSREEKTLLMVKKLRLSCVIFKFLDQNQFADVGRSNDNEAKEAKRQQLLDLIDYVTTGKKWFCEEIVPVVLEMVSVNLFRGLPPSPYVDWDPAEDDPALDPQWPHIQLVYEFLLRFVVSSQADVKTLRKYMKKKNKRFLTELIHLFRSEDPREREYLKTILHRIYGKIMACRSWIRKQINNAFFSLIFSEKKSTGISELLEILGSIINGFVLPLKKEHVQFLHTVLIPLHKVRVYPQFSQQLAYCVTQFVDKDPSLSALVLGGLLKYWPTQSATKEQLFLNELEEVFEASPDAEITKVIIPLFSRVAKCVASEHFQVAERALFLWNNDAVAKFTSDHRNEVLPILYPALNSNTQTHWNVTVQSLAFNIIRMFMEMDVSLWDQVSKKFDKELGMRQEKISGRQNKWEKLKQSVQRESGSKMR